MKEKQKIKNARGITLIALVVTIIVLIILAGVSISLVLGENGIITKAGTAKTDTQRASAIEKAKIDILAWQTEQMHNKQSAELTDSKVKEILIGKDYLKEGTLDDEGFKNKDGDTIFKYSDLYKLSQTTSTVTFNPETFELGTAINSEKYGRKVTGYTKTTPEFTTGVWRLFYQDSNYTYLITDECIGSYKPSDYYETETDEDGELKYQTGADVSIVGQKLSKKLLDSGNFFVENNTYKNIRTIAWFTDTEADIWKQYKNEDAVFAIGSPTIELYVDSFNATANANVAREIELEVDTYGYEYNNPNQLKTSCNYGIYNKSASANWWIASPIYTAANCGFRVLGSGRFDGSLVNSSSYAHGIRPIVCIPTSVFNNKYASTLVEE